MSGAQATWLFTRNDPKVKLSVWKLLSHHHVVASHSPPPWDLLPTVQLNYQLCRNWSSTSPGNYLEGETEKIKVCYFWTYLKCLGQWLNYSENGLVKKKVSRQYVELLSLFKHIEVWIFVSITKWLNPLLLNKDLKKWRICGGYECIICL